MTGSPTLGPPELIFDNHEDGTRQLHIAYCPAAPGWISIAPSSPASRPFVLAALRALRLDPAAGAARPHHAGNDPKNGHNDHKPALTDSTASGMTPGLNYCP
jgi:hypothetical protein